MNFRFEGFEVLSRVPRGSDPRCGRHVYEALSWHTIRKEILSWGTAALLLSFFVVAVWEQFARMLVARGT